MTKKLKTNLNVSPYFDDYDDEKNFHRILFKPSVAVQGRELIQIQTILQDQISRHGSYMFKDGAIVDGCAISFIENMPVAYIKNRFDTDLARSPLDIDKSYMLYANTGVRAVVLHSEVGFELTYPESNRFYLAYLSTGKDVSNNDVYEFTSGQKLYLYNTNQEKFADLDANNLIDSISLITSNATANATGTAYGVTTSNGMIYQKGFFINVDKHTIPVRDHDRNVDGYVIGFKTDEQIINSDQDASLKSPAAGFNNYNAPGADRLKLTPTLVSKPRASTNLENFFAIVEFDGDYPTETNYAEKNLNYMLDILAERTYSESGNYSVKPFKVTTIESDNTANFGYAISSGKAYVNGYEVKKDRTMRISVPKASQTREAEAQIITANFGNYIIVNEAVGTFDFDQVSEVSIYDAAQNTVSQYETSYSAPTGSVVGKANVIGFQYYAGIKGTKTGKYKLFLTNIRMNSGKSFANDAKSFYMTGTYGYAKADVVLENSKAVIKDSETGSLVFPFGVSAIKRLRDASGGNDTNFVFRDITSATMAANGVVTFTTNAPANGGTEKLNSSVGTLSSTNALDYNIKLANNAYSANLAGTMAVNTTSNTVTGTGTAFTTNFVVGDTLRINATGSFYLRSITAIANSTSMTIDVPVATANTIAAYQKYYTAGHVVNLMDFGGSISVISNTQFTVDTKLGFGSNLATGTGTVYAEFPVLRSDAVEIKKVINKNRFVKIDLANNVNGVAGPWNLGISDISKVRSVYVGTTYATANNVIDRFVLNNGQQDTFYGHAKLSVKNAYKSTLNSSLKMLIELDHFTANTTTGVGFFSVDSYPIDDANSANVNAIHTAEIPLFGSTTYGNTIDLRNAIDFRPRKFNTATSANSIASATINPPNANSSFDVPGSGQYLIDPDTNFQADLEYYLPRKDLIIVNKHQDFSVRRGKPHENPVRPMNEDDTVVVGSAFVAPYPSLTQQQARDFHRPDLEVTTAIETVLRYTMEDIKGIEERIARLEYYTTLNLLESKSKDLTIVDENGLDRFKNGIFADSFLNHGLGKTNDIEYSVSIDKDAGLLRPKFVKTAVDLKYNSGLSTGVTKTGHYLTRPYTSQDFIKQRFGTDTRNCTGSMWAWNGNLKLYPSYDHYTNTKGTPPVQVIQDLTAATNVDEGFEYGEWRTASKKNGEDAVKVDSKTKNGQKNTVHTTTTTTTSTLERLVTEITAKTQTDKLNLGKYVTDVSTNPYMRSRIVAFACTGMKPNTVMHCHFNGVNVDAFCAPGELSGKLNFEEGKENEVVKRTGAFGGKITSNSKGEVQGVFKIPENYFRAGDMIFRVANVLDLTVNNSSILTDASQVYIASSTTITTGSTTLVTKTEIPVKHTRTEKTKKVDVVVTVVEDPENPDPPVNPDDVFAHHTNGSGEDPVAQTFTMDVPDAVSGGFLTQIGVFFQTKDKSLGCTVVVMETQLGFPVTSKALGRGYLKPSQISVSADSSVETIFVMENPIYLESGKEYAFMVMPDGNSPEYNLWTAKTGNYDIRTNEQVFQNPYSGIMFISSSSNNWTALQTEDMKFTIYRANFTVGTGSAIFSNDDDDYLTITGLVKESGVRVEVGDQIIALNANSVYITNTAAPTYAWGLVQEVDEANDKVYLDSSVGNLAANTVIHFHRSATPANSATFNANTKIASATIASVDNLEYTAIVPRFATMFPARTTIQYDFKGADGTLYLDTGWTTVEPETDNEFINTVKTWSSKSNDIANGEGGKTARYRMSLTTENKYVSPVVDLTRKSSILINNIINSDSTNEHTRHGEAVTKYVSQNVVLDAELGNAEDINVYVGAYRPNGTDVEVYIKFQGSDDGELFDDKLWTKLAMTDKSNKMFSSPIDKSDFREFEYRVPSASQSSVGSSTDAYLNNGFLEYARSDGSLIVGFNTFSIKIVLLANNSAKIPLVADLRAIALQK